MPIPLIAAAIGGGASAFGSLWGGHKASSIANQQQTMANQAMQRGQPAYNQAYNYYSNILKGGPQLQQSLAPSINAINQTGDQAYKNIVNSAYSRGGALDKALRSVQSGRAFSLADLYGTAQNNAAASLGNLANSDLSRAAGLLGDANQTKYQNQQLSSAAFQGIGGLLTRMLATPGIFGGGGTPSGGSGPANQQNNLFAPSAVMEPLSFRSVNGGQ